MGCPEPGLGTSHEVQARERALAANARAYCDECRSDYLVAFSCSRRVFCPSCAAKRAAIFGALLQEEILEKVGHAQWVFTVPKLLRYWLHTAHRGSRCASVARAAKGRPKQPPSP